MTVTGYGCQTGHGAKRNRAFSQRAKAERQQGVDRIVHVAFVSTKVIRDDARWFIDSEEIHEGALELGECGALASLIGTDVDRLVRAMVAAKQILAEDARSDRHSEGL